jgi:hypothetical protein
MKKSNGKLDKTKNTTQRVTQLNRAPLKSVPDKAKEEKKQAEKLAKEPDIKTWLQKYTSEGEKTTSGAKLATFLFNKSQGYSIEEVSKRCLELSKTKNSKWGTPSHLRSHLRFLKSKACSVTELKKDVYRVSQ